MPEYLLRVTTKKTASRDYSDTPDWQLIREIYEARDDADAALKARAIIKKRLVVKFDRLEPLDLSDIAGK